MRIRMVIKSYSKFSFGEVYRRLSHIFSYITRDYSRGTQYHTYKFFGMRFKWFVHAISFQTVGVVHDVMSRQHCNVIILHNGANSLPIHKNQTTLLRPTGSQEWSLISPKRKSQYKIEISTNFSVYAYISKNLQIESNTLRTRIIN